MHEAFEVAAVAERLPLKVLGEVTSIAAYGNNLLVGTEKGQLLVYSVTATPGDPKGANVQLRETKRTFAKRAVQQLECIPEANLLISLTDTYVNGHDLQTLQPRFTLTKTKNTSLFAVQVAPQPVKGEDAKGHTIRLCCVMKRYLLLFDWDGAGFVEKRDFALPDQARQVVFQGDRVYVGFKRDYILINLATGSTTELFPTGRNQEPLIARVDEYEVLLNKDNISIFVGREGRPTRKFGLVWNEVPSAMAMVAGYCVGATPRFLEVRTVETQVPVQSLKYKGIKFICSANGSPDTAYFAAENTVWRLLPVPIPKQLEHLVAESEFEEALLLLERLPESEYKTTTIQHVRLLHAYHLFDQHKFDESLTLFMEMDSDPPPVIGLYPGLLPEELRKNIKYPIKVPHLEGETLNQALEALVMFLSMKRDRLDRAEQDGATQTASVMEMRQILDTTLLKCFVVISADRLKKRPNNCHIGECEKVLRQKNRWRDLIALYQFKHMDRKALTMLKEMAKEKKSELHGLEPTIEYLKTLTPDKFELIIEFSTWVLQADSVQGLKIFTEGLALRTPRKVVSDYVVNLTLEPPLSPSVEQARRAKIREEALAHLEHVAPTAVPQLLEYLVNVEKDEWPKYHNMLIRCYVKELLPMLTECKKQTDGAGGAPAAAGEEPGGIGTLRQKLLSFLESSHSYNAGELLNDPEFNSPLLLEERALLLGATDQHEQALAIYAHKIKNFDLAMRHCERVYNSDHGGDKNIYLTMLTVYVFQEDFFQSFMSPKYQEPQIDEALKLLTNHSDKIDNVKALDLLPGDVRICALEPFLHAILESTAKRKRSAQIVKNLRKAEHLQVQETLQQYKQRSVAVTYERMCPVCKKRIGSSVVAVYPNSQVVHYACMQNNPLAVSSKSEFGTNSL